MPEPTVPHGAGGCGYLADPSQRADRTVVFWDPAELASVVILTAAPIGAATLSFAPEHWLGGAVRRDGADGAHLAIHHGAIWHQLWLPNPPAAGAPLAAVIPLDATAPVRAEAALKFWMHIGQGRSSNPKRRARRFERLVMALRALDGRVDGASYRTIAEGLFGEQRIHAEPWKTSSLRDAVIRLARAGFGMTRGGYRDLLKIR